MVLPQTQIVSPSRLSLSAQTGRGSPGFSSDLLHAKHVLYFWTSALSHRPDSPSHSLLPWLGIMLHCHWQVIGQQLFTWIVHAMCIFQRGEAEAKVRLRKLVIAQKLVQLAGKGICRFCVRNSKIARRVFSWGWLGLKKWSHEPQPMKLPEAESASQAPFSSTIHQRGLICPLLPPLLFPFKLINFDSFYFPDTFSKMIDWLHDFVH